MINKYAAKQYCCEDISLIENYELAIKDDVKYVCHHRLEIELHLRQKQLKELDLYYNRPASELIFLTDIEHKKLHAAGEYNTMYGRNKGDQLIKSLSEQIRKIFPELSMGKDGKKIVSASLDHTVKVWDANSGVLLQTFGGHSDLVTSATFSQDGEHIVSSSYDDTAILWDFPDLQRLIEGTQDRFKTRPLTEEERRKYYLE